jgi:Mn2+/Fe2+ NRAMP family transporter
MKFLRSWKFRFLLFFAVVGPGFITANVDNDAGGIFTYSQAGAQFGYMLLWTMIPITIALIVVQEMCARMGAVTGKGLSDLIREEFGLRITFLMMLGILITNFGNVVTEFIGIVGSMGLFGVSKVHRGPDLRRDRLAHRRQRPVQERGESFPGCFVLLHHLHICRSAGQARMD